MFERLCTLYFTRYGWVYNEYRECQLYLDGTRILLQYDDFTETYIASETNIEINFYFISCLKAFISAKRNNDYTHISLKQLLSYDNKNKDNHTISLQNLIIDMIPGTELLTNIQIDPNFMYDKEHIFLIPYSDYVEYFI